ncbi:MAG TPA: hypothetical protein DEQ76_01420 [Ruminococcus sp.]|nr:hypothetical protein [Ruminococcus sp.]
MPAEFLVNLPKNLTTHLTHKLCAVFPKEKDFRRIGECDTERKRNLWKINWFWYWTSAVSTISLLPDACGNAAFTAK